MTLPLLYLAARLWLAGCWLAGRRLRELALDPTPPRVDVRVYSDRVRLCAR